LTREQWQESDDKKAITREQWLESNDKGAMTKTFTEVSGDIIDEIS
jgi:hypothetical protein